MSRCFILPAPRRIFSAANGMPLVMFAISLAVLLCISHNVLAGTSPAESGSASGTVTIDGSQLRLKHAYGMAQPNTFDNKKTDIAVLITEQPLPADAFSELEDLMDATQKQHNWVFFKINAEGKPIYEVLDHPKLGKNRLMMSGFTHAAFIAKTLGKDRVEGTFETGKAVDFMGYQYEIRVVFQTPLIQAKLPEPLPDEKTGSSLPAGGGKPGKAYLAYVKAIRSGDIKSFRRLFSPDKADLTDDELKEGLEMLRQMTPEDLTITKGFTAGNHAVLYITGTVEKEKEYGTIEMKKTGGGWQIVRESWSNTPPKP